MKYFVLNRGDERSRELAEQFHDLARKNGLALEEEKPDIVVSIGGDGTMLHAFHLFKDKLDHTAFVGVHTGRLGFYADWQADELPDLVRCMADPALDLEARLVKYPLLQVEITRSREKIIHYALNECTLRGLDKMLVAELHINGQIFETFRGDGICISTPTGSTAYNKSLGGAVTHPWIEAIQVTEIASINNRIYRTLGSAILLPKHHHLDFYPQNKQMINVTVDHLQAAYDDIVAVRGMVAAQKIKFARFRPFPFWNRVREAFIRDERQAD